ncbi:MAG: hypothetical protein ACK452_06230 [Bacteroidota bacterium]
MKKLVLSKGILTAIFLSISLFFYAQINEGAITYTMTIDGLPPEQAAMMEGMQSKTIFKNGKSRSEMSSAFMNSVTVSDEKGNYTVLMDGMGQKSYVKGSAEDKKKSKNEKKSTSEPEQKITYTEETKSIAGFDCKKAIVETENAKGESSKGFVWYTDKIKPIETGGRRGTQFKGLRGVPMEFEMKQGPMKIKVSAVKFSGDKVSDSVFEVSTDGYTEMDPNSMPGM